MNDGGVLDENPQQDNEESVGWQPLPKGKDKQESTGERFILSPSSNSKNMRVLTDAEIEQAAVQSAETQAEEVKSRRVLRRKVPVGAFAAANKVLHTVGVSGGCVGAYYAWKNAPASVHSLVLGIENYPVGDAVAILIGFAVGCGIGYFIIALVFEVVSRLARRPLP